MSLPEGFNYKATSSPQMRSVTCRLRDQCANRPIKLYRTGLLMRMERACRFELDGKPLSSPTPGRCAGLWVVEGRRSSPVHPSWLGTPSLTSGVTALLPSVTPQLAWRDKRRETAGFALKTASLKSPSPEPQPFRGAFPSFSGRV